MPQKAWTYLAKGSQIPVHLKHDEEKREVFIFVNEQLFLHEENVPEQGKVFNFFIDGELCRVIMRRMRGEYTYQFKVERQSTSKTSQERQQREQALNRFGMRWALGIVALLIGVPLCIYFYIAYSNTQELEEFGEWTTGKVLLVGIYSRSEDNTAYTFTLNGKDFAGGAMVPVNDRGEAVLDNGMPLKMGDEFEVRFSTKDTSINEMHFDRPTEHQLTRYKKLIYDKCLTIPYQNTPTKIDPNLDAYCICMTRLLWDNFGLDGLANYYFQDESFIVNSDHNSGTYEDLMEDPEFRGKYKNCLEHL